MKEQETLDDFVCEVHRSLIEKPVMMGIGSTAFYIILMITVFLMSFIGAPCIVIGLIALQVCRVICKREPQKLEFIIQSLGLKDIYRG